MKTLDKKKALGVISGVAVAGVLLGQLAAVAEGERSDRSRTRELARLKQVTAAYHNDALAIAGEYEATDQCVASEQGGMGYHYAKVEWIDEFIDQNQPEALLYAPAEKGTRKLTGIEYVKVDADQNVNTDDDRPSLFGQPFDGPMPGHEPGMPVHYDLHVWVWRTNPQGVFAQWNPRVTCPT
ncbi:MAG: hypothetical protein M3O70_29185 [Actinomycetota bacterium]|nr:hypothetical protein [Actinomycetota bacterium]